MSLEGVGIIRTLDDLPLPRVVPRHSKAKQEPVSLIEAIKKIGEMPKAKFDETVDISLNLGIDPRRGDQMVRGVAMLPHGTGKKVRVAVFAKDDAALAAKESGAEVIGAEDLVQKILDSGVSDLGFDKCIATPDLMPQLGKVARILGPRGLMPNPKLGTVTTNVSEAVKALKKGRVEYRADKGGIIHAGIGKRSFSEEALQENIISLVKALIASRPKGVKGTHAGGYIRKASLSTTMGSGIPVSVQTMVKFAIETKDE